MLMLHQGWTKLGWSAPGSTEYTCSHAQIPVVWSWRKQITWETQVNGSHFVGDCYNLAQCPRRWATTISTIRPLISAARPAMQFYKEKWVPVGHTGKAMVSTGLRQWVSALLLWWPLACQVPEEPLRLLGRQHFQGWQGVLSTQGLPFERSEIYF